MRYLVGFVLFLLALGTLRVVGCGEGEVNPCEDGNECTHNVYYAEEDSCATVTLNGKPCNFDGVPGRCDYQTCKEDLCVGVNCDDGDICTEDRCFFTTGQCDYYNAGLQGEPCTRNGLPGVCYYTYCRTFDCADEDCDDGDLCTDDGCTVQGPLGPPGTRYDECVSFPADCGDGNECTDDTCDPDTGCIHTPVPDGQRCCARWEPCSGFCFCIPGPCPDECVTVGDCQNGVCVPD